MPACGRQILRAGPAHDGPVTVELPDPDWFLDHVVVPAGPERAPIGPIRAQLGHWTRVATRLASGDGRAAAAAALACRQGFVLTRRQARDAGLTDRRIRTLLRRGVWSSPRYGVLSPLAATAETTATAAGLRYPRTVLSYASAAELHGLPLLRPAGRPTLTAQKDNGCQTCTRDDIRLHLADLPAEDVDRWFGTPVTTIARTVADLARSRGIRDGLVAADAALHECVVTPAELRDVVTRQRGWPGVRTARWVVEFADGRAESPLESLARLCFAEHDLPAPEPQVWIATSAGSYRVDFVWAAERVIVETDGLLKYRDTTAIVEEKRRQVHLERAGYEVVRLMWDDVVNDPADAAGRVRAALLEHAA